MYTAKYGTIMLKEHVKRAFIRIYNKSIIAFIAYKKWPDRYGIHLTNP